MGGTPRPTWEGLHRCPSALAAAAGTPRRGIDEGGTRETASSRWKVAEVNFGPVVTFCRWSVGLAQTVWRAARVALRGRKSSRRGIGNRRWINEFRALGLGIWADHRRSPHA
jgi:hypothetical protein